jgi:hypothetical protein
MIRNKLYDELEKEGYSFTTLVINGQRIPRIEKIDNWEDWALVNTTMVINGQYQVQHGPAVSQRTVDLLQRVIEETSKPDYSDYYSKKLFEDGE